MREIVNPFNVKEVAKPELATASAEKSEQEIATASALSNVNPSMCPKCGGKMGTAFLYNRKPVYYCDVDRVTHPQA
jgi:uncharacterized protein (DUF983 family)